MALGKSKRNAIIAVVVVLASLYRFVSPYLDETKQMRQEGAQLQEEISHVKNEGASYSKGWERKMDEKENHLLEELPDSQNSSLLLDYFLTRFEMDHPGKVVFVEVRRQNASTTEFKVGNGRNAAHARSVRYKIKAQLGQDLVIPYMEHIEKFAGLFRIEEVEFTSVPGSLLEMELTLEFFLAPSEWSAPAGKVIAAKGEANEESEKAWHSIFLMKPVASLAKRKLAAEPVYRKPPTPTQVVGRSVVIDESIYEEGDHVRGWEIQHVDSQSRSVVFKRGNLTHRVVVK